MSTNKKEETCFVDDDDALSHLVLLSSLLLSPLGSCCYFGSVVPVPVWVLLPWFWTAAAAQSCPTSTHKDKKIILAVRLIAMGAMPMCALEKEGWVQRNKGETRGTIVAHSNLPVARVKVPFSFLYALAAIIISYWCSSWLFLSHTYIFTLSSSLPCSSEWVRLTSISRYQVLMFMFKRLLIPYHI